MAIGLKVYGLEVDLREIEIQHDNISISNFIKINFQPIMYRVITGRRKGNETCCLENAHQENSFTTKQNATIIIKVENVNKISQ